MIDHVSATKAESETILDKSILEDFKMKYLLSGTSIVGCAGRNLAYRDVQRVIHGIGKWQRKDEFIDAVIRIIAAQIELLIKVSASQDEVDDWHRDTCKAIIEVCAKENMPEDIVFTYGTAQKWINMTLKNMLAMGLWNDDLEHVIQFLHLPVDNKIIEKAKEKLNIHRPKTSWSKLDYSEYMKFQKDIRNKIENSEEYTCPMDFEFKEWANTAE